MSVWNILGIEKTKDEKAIKIAYRKKLPTVNPEDDAEGFKNLREAYEKAVEYANTPDEDATKEVDDSPMGRFMQEFARIYQNIELRRDPEQWRELFKQDIANQLDTSLTVLEECLKFIMDYFSYPQEVWQVFDEQFGIIEKQEYLMEHFPKDFIEYVVNSIRYEDSMNYTYFVYEEGKDYDGFIRTFYDVQAAINQGRAEDAKKGIEELKGFQIDHPYVKAMKARVCLVEQNGQEALDIIAPLSEEYPEDVMMLLGYAESYLLLGDIEHAYEKYEQILKINPEHYTAKVGKADCFMKQEKYEEARDLYVELIRKNNYDNYVRGCIMRVNELLIQSYKDKIAENPENEEVFYEYIWCLFQNYQYEQVLQELVPHTPKEDRIREHNNLLGRTYLCVREFEKAVVCFDTWIASILSIPEDTEEEDLIRDRKRLGYAYFVKAEALKGMNDLDGALELLELAVQNEEEMQAMMLELKTDILLTRGSFEECIAACEEVLRMDERNYGAYLNKAKAEYELGYHRDALDDCQECKNLYPYAPQPYSIQAKIFTEHEEYETAQTILNQYTELVPTTDEIQFRQAMLFAATEELQKADDLLAQIAENWNSEESDLDTLERVYFEHAEVKRAMGDYQASSLMIAKALQENPKSMEYLYFQSHIYRQLQMMDKAIESVRTMLRYEPDNAVAHAKLGDFLSEGNREEQEQAREEYQKAIACNPRHSYAYGRIGLFYEEEKNYEKALEYFNMQLEINPYDYYYIERGNVYMNINEYEKALQDFEAARDESPESQYPYYNMGVALMQLGRYEEAIEHLKKSIALSDGEPELYLRKLGFVYMRVGDLEQAEATFARLEKMNKVSSLFRRAGIYGNRRKDFKKAEELIYEVIKLINKEDREYYLSCLLWYYEQCEQPEKDIVNFMNKVKRRMKLEKDTNLQDWYGEMAGHYRHEKDYKKAISLYEKALEQEVVDEEVFYGLAVCYHFLGDDDRAKNYAKICIEKCMPYMISYDSKIYYLNWMIYCAYILEDKELMEEYIEEARACHVCMHCQYQGCHEFHEILSDIAREEGNTEEAIEEIKKSIAYDEHDVYYRRKLDELQSLGR